MDSVLLISMAEFRPWFSFGAKKLLTRTLDPNPINVREFFASQRSRVRKHVRLSREDAIKVEAARVSQEGCSTRPDQPMHVTDPTPLNPVDSNADAEKTLEAGCSISSDAAMPVINPIPLTSMGPKAI